MSIAAEGVPLKMDELNRYKTSLEQEKQARQQAELLLETKTRDFYEVNEKLSAANLQLEQQQNELLKTEKLASLGTLSAGIAHEINNPLAFIKSNIGTLHRYFYFYQEHMPDETGHVSLNKARAKKLDFIQVDGEEIFEELKDGIERVQNIVSDLKSFARSKASDVRLCDTNEAITAALRITNNQHKYSCEVETDLQELPLTLCNLNELSQVFINMIMNAVDAIDERGHIKISSRHDKGWLIYQVEDNGQGIAEAELSQIFNPFYTAKEVGKGTGLGLSVSYGIIESLKGNIDVRSTVDVGTCFTIKIPVNDIVV